MDKNEDPFVEGLERFTPKSERPVFQMLDANGEVLLHGHTNLITGETILEFGPFTTEQIELALSTTSIRCYSKVMQVPKGVKKGNYVVFNGVANDELLKP